MSDFKLNCVPSKTSRTRKRVFQTLFPGFDFFHTADYLRRYIHHPHRFPAVNSRLVLPALPAGGWVSHDSDGNVDSRPTPFCCKDDGQLRSISRAKLPSIFSSSQPIPDTDLISPTSARRGECIRRAYPIRTRQRPF